MDDLVATNREHCGKPILYPARFIGAAWGAGPACLSCAKAAAIGAAVAILFVPIERAMEGR